jgi:hypothetical protein
VKPRRNIFPIIGMIALALMLQGCFVLDVLPSDPQTKKTGGGRPTDPQPQQPIPPKPAKLSPQRLMRRLAIDLTGQLPQQADIDALAADPAAYAVVAERMISSAEAAGNIAALHRRMWSLRADQMPDLDGYIAGGDSDLESKLTGRVRELISIAPTQHVRWVYDKQLPFSTVFSSGYAMATDELLDLWEATSDGSAWPGDVWRFHSFADGRPDGGILNSPALNALVGSRGQQAKISRSFALLQRFTCATMDQKDAHTFYALTGEELLAGPQSLVTSRKECAVCHRQIEAAAGALKEFSTGDDFSAWLSWSAPAADYSGYYNGLPFTGAAAWIDAMSSDRRLARCEAQKLSEALYQRPYGSFDTATTSIGLAAYEENGGNLRDIVRAVIRSEEYQSDLVTPAVKGEYERSSSGIRTLRRHQWMSIMSSLVPGAASLTYPESLDPGADETINGADMTPTGSYWHEVDKLARKAAALIVAEELADTTVTMNRRVFTILPDGSSYGVSTTGVYAQIKVLWQRLTGEPLEDTSTIYTDFQTLWAASAPDDSADDFRRAWRVVLTAMFTHPRFVTY